MFGLGVHRTEGNVYRPTVKSLAAMQAKPVCQDTYDECSIKLALFEMKERAKDAGVVCCCNEGEFA